MKFELHITVPGDAGELVGPALEQVAEILGDPAAVGDMGGIYHPNTAMRIGYWQFT